jgi:hypothetical protein
MPVRLLRWKSGAGGDTVLKILLESNPDLHSQNSYETLLDTNKTNIDSNFIKSFEYSQIAKMSLKDAQSTDIDLLLKQLDALNKSSPTTHWLLKTHLYYNFTQEVVDITVGEKLLPFMLRAGMHKNSRSNDRMNTNYHPLATKIKDPDVLYKFDCYNIITHALSNSQCSNLQIDLNNILAGWDDFRHALSLVNLYAAPSSREYYENWVKSNRQFYPSDKYISLVNDKNYDYTLDELSIEERYCLLALAGKKFLLIK